MRKKPLLFLILWASVCLPSAADPPAVVVQITIDGLPTEMLMRHATRLNPKGLGRFLSEGVGYLNAEYPYLVTYTAVGHASLFTGALPGTHGILGNEWIDSVTGKPVYCVEDKAHVLLDFPTKEHEGTSPANLTSATVGDALVLASNGRGRVFSVSGKDRGAILPAGKKGKAFWYGKTAGTYLTSDYYYAATPGWINPWRERHGAAQYQHAVWQLFRAPGDYDRIDADDRPSEKGMGAVFPHDMTALPADRLADGVRWTPFIDELTLEFARELCAQERLGCDGRPDMLCVSFSALDFVSHQYGPDSLEAEDTLYRVDGLVADLLGLFEADLDQGRLVAVLAADHGFGISPEQAKEEGFPSTRVTGAGLEVLMNELRNSLKTRWNLGPEAVLGFMTPFIYLNDENVRQSGTDICAVRRTVADIAVSWPGVAWTATRDDLAAGRLPRSKLHDRAYASYNPNRGGDVLVTTKPWCVIETVETAYPSTHGSPYAYDTRVPVFFLGGGVTTQRVSRPVSPLDIAPTLALLWNITPPPDCAGVPLAEVLDGRP